jgi:hypothetical protein
MEVTTLCGCAAQACRGEADFDQTAARETLQTSSNLGREAHTMLADPILTNGWGAELLAPGLTRPEFKPSQSFRPVPII